MPKDDPSIFGGIGRAGCEHHYAGPALAVEPVEHSPQRLRLDERRVAVKNEHRSFVAGERFGRLLDRMAGPFLVGLVRDGHVASVQRDFHLVAAFADHHHAPVGAEPVDAVEQVQQQRAAGDRVKHLVRVGAHARALPGGKDDHGEFALVVHKQPSISTPP